MTEKEWRNLPDISAETMMLTLEEVFKEYGERMTNSEKESLAIEHTKNLRHNIKEIGDIVDTGWEGASGFFSLGWEDVEKIRELCYLK